MTTSKPRSRRILKKSSMSTTSSEPNKKYIDELLEKISDLKKQMHTQRNKLHPAPLPKMDTAETCLFQIPIFKLVIDHYKGLDHESHCVFDALHVLGLRSQTLCIEDSKRIFEMYSEENASIANEDIATYLSTIYETDVTVKLHKVNKNNKLPYLDLKDGYGTIVSIQTYDKDDVKKSDDEKSMNGTIIIIYKYKNVIYCYNPSSRKNTVSINEILEEINAYRIEEYICFYKNSNVASLNRKKMIAPILY